jgi:hypothetical protein
MTSPESSEIVVVFPEREAQWAPEYPADVLREADKLKEFQVAFCLETLEGVVQDLHHLRTAAAGGPFDFLPHLPLVISRTVTRYGHFMRLHNGSQVV